ncbi:hypothetical protein BU14_0285s0004 [Porphyra umbilicalis]|uniref:Uncharacterized protein n=1 Tax=Porphyra umbilicalis TaxID=2786 RepID=A0A1X6P0Y2_PORUM|nr:hypothetical protein BU14_0285s0004 [Porphyra umbilicalis]|eukprot:OSX74518.1 hypothetical protein BU14_0285s0004 [Porphyra umbilicalis]
MANDSQRALDSPRGGRGGKVQPHRILGGRHCSRHRHFGSPVCWGEDARAAATTATADVRLRGQRGTEVVEVRVRTIRSPSMRRYPLLAYAGGMEPAPQIHEICKFLGPPHCTTVSAPLSSLVPVGRRPPPPTPPHRTTGATSPADGRTGAVVDERLLPSAAAPWNPRTSRHAHPTWVPPPKRPAGASEAPARARADTTTATPPSAVSDHPRPSRRCGQATSVAAPPPSATGAPVAPRPPRTHHPRPPYPTPPPPPPPPRGTRLTTETRARSPAAPPPAAGVVGGGGGGAGRPPPPRPAGDHRGGGTPHRGGGGGGTTGGEERSRSEADQRPRGGGGGGGGGAPRGTGRGRSWPRADGGGPHGPPAGRRRQWKKVGARV